MKMSSCRRALILGAALFAAAGCDEFANPSELSRSQILAVRADPPVVAPGETARLEVFVAGPDGPVAEPAVTWQVVATGEEGPIGSITPAPDDDSGAAIYTAPAAAPGDPPVITIGVAVRTTDGNLTAFKALVLAGVPTDNPAVTALEVGGRDVSSEPAVALTRGQTVPLSVATEPAATDEFLYAWYTTAGTIERYQSNPSELEVSDTPGESWLIVVVRDGGLGVQWHAVPVTIE